MIRIIAWPAFKNRLENPYNWLLYSGLARLGIKVDEFSIRKVLLGRYSIWHIHWPDSLLSGRCWLNAAARAVVLLALMNLASFRGMKLVWTVHNLASHERFHAKLETWFWSAFTKRIHAYISLSETGREAAVRSFPALQKLPGYVISHGHYRDVYPNELEREEARNQLGIPSGAFVFAFIGQIREYKNVPSLIRVFRQLREPGTVLLVAGRPASKAIADEVTNLARLDSRIRLYPRFIPDSEVEVFLKAADLVVLPYKEILNSGTALLALSFDRPVLVPRLGALGELQAKVGKEWVRTYEGQLTAGELVTAMRWAVNTPRPARAPLEQFAWEEIARETASAYHDIITRRTH